MDNRKFEVKIYSTPKIDVYNISSEIEQFCVENKMFRCKCIAYSMDGERTYVALKNKTRKNVLHLLEKLGDSYPHFEKNLDEILKISSMEVTADPNQCFASIHMIGEKLLNGDKDVINIEWITRKMQNPDNPGYNYKYDDTYYLHFLETLNVPLLSALCAVVNKYFFDFISRKILHLWLVAIDYYTNGNKKYKIYFKIDEKFSDLIKKSFLASFLKEKNC